MPQERKTLGQIIHALRTRQGWTLKEMSVRTGIPLSTLAKVEKDQLSLTYDKIQMMAHRLGLSMGDFLSEGPDPGESVVTARRSVGRPQQAVRVETDNYVYHYLCAELKSKRMVPMWGKIKAKSVDDFQDLPHHSGEEFIFVIDGKIEVHTQFYEPETVQAGEGMYLDSSMGHAYTAKDCDEATVLVVCAGAESDLHEQLIAAAKAPRKERRRAK